MSILPTPGNMSATATPQQHLLQIWYSPLPEEEHDPEASAAREFANRVHVVVPSSSCDDVRVDMLDLEKLQAAVAATTTNSLQSYQVLHLFILSCDADGSVHRAVRKISREFSKNSGGEASPKNQQHQYAVALLGHARCENSAQQMKDTIYGGGRKLDAALQKNSMLVPLISRLELQAELENPATTFDPWIGALWGSLISLASSNNGNTKHNAAGASLALLL